MARRGKTAAQSGSIQQTTTFQYLILLVFLTVLNISFFFGHGISYNHVQCSTDMVFDALSRYVIGNANTPLDECIPKQCSKADIATMRHFSDSVRQLVGRCKKLHEEYDEKPKHKAIVTLITTFADHVHTDMEKVVVHNNTIVNWSKLRPRVNLILFTNDSQWKTLAKRHGWEVVTPKTGQNSTRPPVLKEMFAVAKSRYNTTWYGYVNADILFTGDLLVHLDALEKLYNMTDKRIMLTGRRTNVDRILDIDPVSDISLKEAARAYGTLYKEDAEDFFITSNSFPWQQILPVVVGRPAYDNWLVAEARCRLQTDIIDVTDTLLALHQTTVVGGNSEGHSHPETDLNVNIFKANKVVPNYLAGLTTCIPYNSYFTLCDTLDIYKRTNSGMKCGCDIK